MEIFARAQTVRGWTCSNPESVSDAPNLRRPLAGKGYDEVLAGIYAIYSVMTARKGVSARHCRRCRVVPV